MCVLFEVPVVASFSKTAVRSTPVSQILTGIFGFTTIMKFVTLSLSLDLQKNILRYLTSSFLLDFVATVPFDIICIGRMNFPDTLLLLRLLHVRNVVHIFNHNPIYVSISHFLQKTFKVGSSFMSIFMLGGVLITFLHLHGCFIFLFGKLAYFDSASWRAVHEVLEVPMSEQYIWAYFAAVANTFPITGYQPSDPFEQVFSIVAALVGAVLYAILVGTISSFSFGLDSSGRRYKEKIDEVHEYMTYRKLSEPIKVKVRQYYELKYKGKYFDEDAILSEMNESLKQEIAVHNCRDLIAKVPFLKREVGDGRDSLFLARIAKVLRPVYFIKGDLIFDQGWVGNEMYFIQQGCVAIIVNGNRVGELRDGAFFGEVALLGEMPRTATIIAAGNTILYSFGRSDFSTILKDYEDMALKIKIVFEERMAKIKKEKDAKLQMEAAKQQRDIEILGTFQRQQPS
ncbi:cyclic nucleotide-binding-like protein [Obelidium mucronatum]|nr:cyclic nucleotide-binding-like protein [Obelidium mucronatum]